MFYDDDSDDDFDDDDDDDVTDWSRWFCVAVQFSSCMTPNVTWRG